jgi:glycosyltransferase involved in cell wall biosynthesis
MSRLLFISHDVVGSEMAGPGIRAAELARVLAGEHAVTLATPQPADMLPAGVRNFTYRWGDAASLAPALDTADLIVANGLVLAGHPQVVDRPVPLVLDLYDPTPMENLVLWRGRDAAERAEQSRRDVALLLRQLRAGDCFLCATEHQRDMYLGALLASGRIAPELADADPTLRGLLRVVPFGLPSMPPAPARPPWDAREGEQVILWSGGLWDWMDPLTLLRAMPQVLAAAPYARLVLLAGRHPGAAVRMRMPERARALAAELGLGDRIVFVDRWLPYAERAGALLNTAVAVYLHAETLESAYAAVRSRFLDHLWAGLPSLVSGGDAAAALVAEHGLGRVVAPGDVDGTAAALIALLANPGERQDCAERACALAAEYTWQRVAAPLLDFCREPRRTTNDERRTTNDERRPTTDQRPTTNDQRRITDHASRITHHESGIEHMNDENRNQAVKRLDELWKVQPQPLTSGIPLLGQAKELANSLARWYMQSIVEQQNAFNAAVVQALQALSANDDRRHNELIAHVHSLHSQMNGLRQELAALLRRIEQDERRVEQDEQRIEQLAQHLADADEADTALAGRFLQLQQQLAARNGEHQA